MLNIKKIFATLTLGAVLTFSYSMVSYADTIEASDGEVNIASIENPEEEEAIEKISKVVQMSYATEYDNLSIGNEFSIYNEDQDVILYVYPVFENEECVLLAYSTDTGAVSVTENTEFYEETSKLEASEEDYYLYICGGTFYAENEDGKEEICETGVKTYSADYEYMNRSYNNKLKKYSKKERFSKSISDKNEIEEIELVAKAVSSTVSTGTNNIRYSDKKCKITKFVSQNNRGMCWAASVATIVDYKTSYNVSAYDVCNKMGIGYDAGGTMSQMKKALKKYGLSYSKVMGKLSWSKVKNNINSDRPFSIYLANSDYTGAHAVTAYGYGTAFNSIYNCVYIWDSNNYKTSFLYDGIIITSGNIWNWYGSVY